jgi:RNA polymerase sigma factor (sigma-70 family)
MTTIRHASDSDELAPTRLSLIERLRDLDDQGSWQEFFDTYWKLIYCAAVKGGLPDNEAEDVVQEAIIGIARNMENFRYEPEVCSFKGWLMHVTRCRIIDHLRKRPSAKYSFVPLPNDEETEENDPTEPEALVLGSPSEREFEDLWDQEWKKNLVDAAMERVKRRISPEHYQIFYLHSVKGMLARDIAELFGASMAKVYVIRHRVARMIKSEARSLERKGLQQ